MKAKMTTTYHGTDAHRLARAAAAVAEQVFNADVSAKPIASGQWLVHSFPTTIPDAPCRLSHRGVYVEAPGGMTEQFLNPTDDSVVQLHLVLDNVDPLYEDAKEPQPDETVQPEDNLQGPGGIELDPDNPVNDEPPEEE